jgi:uncharacterized protein YlxW (UPF0749 family)
MGNGLLFLILLVAALAAVLSGMAVFSNSRPPDARINQVMDDIDEIKGLVNQLQKSVLQIERKVEKEGKDGRAELKELLERIAERIDRRLQETGG